MADVIDYGEVKFGVRNESVTCSAQTFLMKAATAAAGGLSGVGPVSYTHLICNL